MLELVAGFDGNPHPEDNFICTRSAPRLHAAGIRFAPYEIAERFAFEGRSWNGVGNEWEGVPIPWRGQFGFHSFLTPLPTAMDRPKVFHHSGDMGDLIYGFAVIKALGAGTLFISSDNRHPYPTRNRVIPTPQWVGSLASLANMQDYIWNTQWTHALPFSADYDLNKFRDYFLRPGFNKHDSLFALQQREFSANHPEDLPWLRVDAENQIAPIVVNRTQRYHNDYFPWKELVQKYGNQMIFVGQLEEYRDFTAYCGSTAIGWQPTPNLADLARVIAGAKVFIGNQSTPMAIALGLGKNTITEAWYNNPNCNLHRENQIHCLDAAADIPKDWL